MIGTVMEQMLTVSDVARLLQVSEETVRRWLRDETIAAIQFGNEWRVEPKDLQAFIDSRKGPQRKRKK